MVISGSRIARVMVIELRVLSRKPLYFVCERQGHFQRGFPNAGQRVGGNADRSHSATPIRPHGAGLTRQGVDPVMGILDTEKPVIKNICRVIDPSGGAHRMPYGFLLS
ncbi:hypothetical protein HAX54_047436 [Datura stramonium]|uniref:Uncharacterized protein n=1 Tax=Datura stramonium TaxID=4076 RepID=A0ABS8SSF0_DATST|nr:hypothetical protein [Datura stramonium]